MSVRLYATAFISGLEITTIRANVTVKLVVIAPEQPDVETGQRPADIAEIFQARWDRGSKPPARNRMVEEGWHWHHDLHTGHCASYCISRSVTSSFSTAAMSSLDFGLVKAKTIADERGLESLFRSVVRNYDEKFDWLLEQRSSKITIARKGPIASLFILLRQMPIFFLCN